MCGRYVSPAQAEIERAWNLVRRGGNPFAARYNVAPQQGNPENHIPVLRRRRDGTLELVRLQWWLLPWWHREPRIRHTTFNARVETVAKLASFRDPLARRRCIVPALGWYEWQETPAGNLPWFLHARDGGLLSFAGLWDRWRGRGEHEGQVIESCTLVVGPANTPFGRVHDRMPFALDRDRALRWMDPDLTSPDAALALLKPVPHDAIAFHRVSRAVNNARNEGAHLIDPVDEEEEARGPLI